MNYRSSTFIFAVVICLVLLPIGALAQGDSDQDGFPNGQDACPNQPAPNSNDGCPPPSNPVETETPPSDQDGDGNIDVLDNCPNQGGPASNGGCPINNNNGSPNPEDGDGDGIPDSDDICPQSVGFVQTSGCNLPVLPDENDCRIATGGAYYVNIRTEQSLDADIVSRLNPELIYTPLGYDNGWYYFDEGWVNETVLRTGGECNPNEVTVNEPEIAPTAVPSPDVCPSYLIVYMSGEGALENPIEFLERLAGEIIDSALLEEHIVDGVFTPDIEVEGNIYIGNDCAELILGTEQADLIDGRGGNDRIYGFGGNNTLVGGTGNNGIIGGDDNDLIIGGDDYDYIRGHAGDDVIYGNGNRDDIYGMVGNDRIYGGAGDDNLYGGDGVDFINGGSGTNFISH